MKRCIALATLSFLLIDATLRAQGVFEISPSVGYLFIGKTQFVEGVVDLQNTASIGLAISAEVSKYGCVEIDYTWATPTDLIFTSQNDSLFEDFSANVNLHHLTLNTVNYLAQTDDFQLFFRVGAGATIYALTGEEEETSTRFSLTTGLGFKYYLNDRIGLRLQTQSIAPVHYSGDGYYTGLTLNGTVALFETGIRGGVVIRL